MNPETIRTLIPDYLAGTLSPADRALFEAQLAADPELQAEVAELSTLWRELGELPQPDPSPRLRARFYQRLHAYDRPARARVWLLQWAPRLAVGAALVLLGFVIGRHVPHPSVATQPQNPEVAQLRDQVEGLRQTVALSLLDKQSAASRLQGISWSSQIDRPDQELLNALLTTLNHDPNINVRLASLDALEKFTADPGVRTALEQSIPTQQSPLVQIALIDSLVHIKDRAARSEFQKLSSDNETNPAVRERAGWALQKLNFN
jgi:HEAT repeat protein